MAIFHVNQSKSYNVCNKFIWAPSKNDIGYRNLKKIKKGDYILHYHEQCIKAISIVESGFKESNVPSEPEYENWKGHEFGYYVAIESITEIINPRKFNAIEKNYFKENNYEGSPYDKNGNIKQRLYVSELNEKYSIFILKILLNIQENTGNISFIKDILESLSCDLQEYSETEIDLQEYSETEMIAIDGEISSNYSTKRDYELEPESKCIQKTNNEREIQKRDPKKAAEVLNSKNHKCECSNIRKYSHSSFKRKGNDCDYMEPHHLIPLSKHEKFEHSLDVISNIVCLCSTCHNLLHYGRFEDKKELLKELYNNERKSLLDKQKISITEEELFEFYK